MSERTNDANGELRDPHGLLEHDGFLRALARSLVLDATRADDVVQQAYVAALQVPVGGAGEPRSARAWLASVVRNIAWKLRRSELRRSNFERAGARSEALPSVADVIAREQARRRVVDAVLRLEEPTRSTMLLRYFDRLPPRAIAKQLGVPVETVRSRIKRALERLRLELDREYGGEGDRASARATWLAAIVPFTKGAPLATLATATAATKVVLSSVGAGVLVMSTKANSLGSGGAERLALVARMARTRAARRFAPHRRRARTTTAEPRDVAAAGRVAHRRGRTGRNQQARAVHRGPAGGVDPGVLSPRAIRCAWPLGRGRRSSDREPQGRAA